MHLITFRNRLVQSTDENTHAMRAYGGQWKRDFTELISALGAREWWAPRTGHLTPGNYCVVTAGQDAATSRICCSVFVDTLIFQSTSVGDLVSLNCTSHGGKCCCYVEHVSCRRSEGSYAKNTRTSCNSQWKQSWIMNVGHVGKLQRTDIACRRQWWCYVGTNYNVEDFAEYASTLRWNSFVFGRGVASAISSIWYNGNNFSFSPVTNTGTTAVLSTPQGTPRLSGCPQTHQTNAFRITITYI